MFTTEFWKGAGERAVKTFLQTFVAVVVAGLGADAVGVSAGLLDVSWLDALSVSALATIMSLATSAGNADFTAGRVETSPAPAEQTTYNIQIPAGMDTETVEDQIRNTGRSTGPHVRFETDEPGKHVAENK